MSEASAFLEAEPNGAKGGTRTLMAVNHRILSPARLPVPPLSRDTDRTDSTPVPGRVRIGELANWRIGELASWRIGGRFTNSRFQGFTNQYVASRSAHHQMPSAVARSAVAAA